MLRKKKQLVILLCISLIISVNFSFSLHHHENPYDNDNCQICDHLLNIYSYSIDQIPGITNAEIVGNEAIICSYSIFQLNVIGLNYSLRSPPII